MPLPRTPKSAKKKKFTPKKEVPKKKEEEEVIPVTPISEQLLEQKKKENTRKMEEQLKALVRQRDAVEKRMKRVQAEIKTTAAAPNENLENLHFLKYQLNNIESAFSKFGEYQEQINAMALSAEEQAKHEKCEVDFEKLRLGLTLTVNELIEKLEKPAVNVALVPTAPATAVVPQYLPPLAVPLPTFDGTFETWYSFKSMFKNVMARYTNEAPAIKLYHLRNSLVGKAAGVIDQDIVNNNDYDAAWAFLEERFEDKRAIIDKHIDAVFGLPKITHDNAAELRKLIDSCVKHVEGLKNLDLPVDGLGEQMIVNLLASRMDRDTRKAWESEQRVGVLPTYAASIAFLKERCRVLERVELSSGDSEKSKRSVALVIAGEAKCSVCNQQHELMMCEQFNKKTMNEKYSHLRKCGLCFSCLKKGHLSAACTSTDTCRFCSRRHHTVLHTDGSSKQNTTTVPEAPHPQRDNRSQPSQRSRSTAKRQALLSTAVVLIRGKNGEEHLCRTLIDSCSQHHFLTERFANLLELKKERTNCSVSGLNGRITRIRHLVRTTIKSRVTPFSAELEFLITPRIIEELPPETIDTSHWNLPAQIELADPKFHSRGHIDMLLGAELFWDLIKEGKLTLAENLPSLRDTELGWIVGGALSNRSQATGNSFCGVVKHGTGIDQAV